MLSVLGPEGEPSKPGARQPALRPAGCVGYQALAHISLSHLMFQGGVVIPILRMKQLRLPGSERCDMFSKVKEVAEPGLEPS